MLIITQVAVSSSNPSKEGKKNLFRAVHHVIAIRFRRGKKHFSLALYGILI